MAEHAKRMCKEGRCKGYAVYPNVYCKEHIALASRHHVKTAKASHAAYNTTAWRNYSRWFRSEHPLCVNFSQCKNGVGVVDHIKPVEQGGGFWDEANHQPLCHSCHNKKRRAERGSA